MLMQKSRNKQLIITRVRNDTKIWLTHTFGLQSWLFSHCVDSGRWLEPFPARHPAFLWCLEVNLNTRISLIDGCYTIFPRHNRYQITKRDTISWKCCVHWQMGELFGYTKYYVLIECKQFPGLWIYVYENCLLSGKLWRMIWHDRESLTVLGETIHHSFALSRCTYLSSTLLRPSGTYYAIIFPVYLQTTSSQSGQAHNKYQSRHRRACENGMKFSSKYLHLWDTKKCRSSKGNAAAARERNLISSLNTYKIQFEGSSWFCRKRELKYLEIDEEGVV